jgi:hypothetical protein
MCHATQLYKHLPKFALMEGQGSTPRQFLLTIPDPQRLLGYLWISLGALLFLTFFLPNFTVASLEITGPKLISDFLRQDTNPARILDDLGFFMMVAVPSFYACLAIITLVLGGLALARRPIQPLFLVFFGLFGFLFSIYGAWVIGSHDTEIRLFAKLLPRPIFGYWIAMATQFLIFAFSFGYWWIKRRGNPVQI